MRSSSSPLRSALSAIFAVILLQALSPSVRAAEGRGEITVTIEGFRNLSGSVRVTLYDKGEGFPMNHKRALTHIVRKVDGLTQPTVFEDLPYGTYAVSVLHDENDNGHIDIGLLGPTEGLGSSNNTTRLFLPPSFKEAAFTLDAPEKPISIRLIYR